MMLARVGADPVVAADRSRLEHRNDAEPCGCSVPDPHQILLPPAVARALRSARRAAGLSLEQVATTCGVAPAVVAELEAGDSRSFDDARSLLTTLEQVARSVGLPADVAPLATLRAWSSAYDEEHVDRDEHRDPQRAAALTTQSLVATPVPEECPGPPGATAPTLMVLNQAGLPAATGNPPSSAPHARYWESASGPVQAAGPARVLRGAISLTAAVLVAVSGALGAVEGGLLGRSGGHRLSTSRSLPTSALPPSRAPLLVELSATAVRANYSVTASTYRVTISANRPSWVELSPSGGSPVFAGIVEPGVIRRFTESGSVTVEVGAGGTSIAVSAGSRSQSLMAPAAPYTYLFSPS